MNNKLSALLLLSLSSLIVGFNSLAMIPGDAVPAFSAKNQDGKVITNDAIKGVPALFYFYPKDESPDCTKEACAFRDSFDRYKKTGVLVFGVSAQDLKSHKEFATHHKIPFDLLDDSDGKLGALFGIEKVNGLYKRQSVLVGSDGKVIKVYTEVEPKTHAETILKERRVSSPKW